MWSPLVRPWKSIAAGVISTAIAMSVADPVFAETYAVGPTRRFHDLGAVAAMLKPGDIVEVDGDTTYPGGIVLSASGERRQPITIIGRRVHGKRPVLAGDASTIEIRGNHYLLRGFEITGGSKRCLYHHGDDITIVDTVVHDCPHHGILGADEGSGSLTLEYVEVYGSGDGEHGHQVYIATDERAYPRSVFRMQHSFIHDGRGGNNVKSRAERNEIDYNWIEGALYHEVELIGPDGQPHDLAREDSDVVGNVIRKTRKGYAIRIGGDGTGDTDGRYRFINNTVVIATDTKAVFRLFDGVESIEADNNVFYRQGGGPILLFYEDDVRWSTGKPLIAGTSNWIPDGSTHIPVEWRHTCSGRDPGFVSDRDLRPAEDSPLIGAGAVSFQSPPGCTFPSPLPLPLSCPPNRRLEVAFTAPPRRWKGSIDIGAFEHGMPLPEEPMPAQRTAAASPIGAVTRGGCGCRSTTDGRSAASAESAIFGVACALRLRRRKRR